MWQILLPLNWQVCTTDEATPFPWTSSTWTQPSAAPFTRPSPPGRRHKRKYGGYARNGWPKMECTRTPGQSMWCSLCCQPNMAMRGYWTTSIKSRETVGRCMSIRPSSRSTYAPQSSPLAPPTCHTRRSGCMLVSLGSGQAINQCWSHCPASRETLRSARSGQVLCSSLRRRWRSRWSKKR